jgi:hypothetical protein
MPLLFGCSRFQILNLASLNKLKERKRVACGKPAKLPDFSMMNAFRRVDSDEIGEQGLQELTDGQNDEFQYLL